MANQENIAGDLDQIGKAVLSLSQMLDRFAEKHGSEAMDELDVAFPGAQRIDSSAVKAIHSLEQKYAE